MLTVSAPASTMLMGEHAVLFGHRAIVCAVDKRIHVQLTPRTDRLINISSSLTNFQSNLDDILAGKVTVKELSFVLASVQVVQPISGFDLQITSEFSHTVGLGSSASVTSATVCALLLFKKNLLTHDNRNDNKNYQALLDEVFSVGLEVILKVQKRGSGSDLVASVYGGLQGYTAQPRKITPLLKSDIVASDLTTTDLIANNITTTDMTSHDNQSAEQATNTLPSLCLTYCGYKTPTPVVLSQVAEQAEQFPQLYKGIYEQMNAVTVQAETAIIEQNWQALGKLMNIYHGLMDALGVCDEKLAELVYHARNNKHVLGSKISGSGLGDCIITLSSIPTVNSATSISANELTESMSVQISDRGLIFH